MNRRSLVLGPVLSALGLLACTVTTAPTGDPASAPAASSAVPVAPPPSATSPAPTASSSGDAAPPPAPPSGTPPQWGADKCPAPGARGFAVGETLGDLGIRDCDTGAPASLDEVCGASATWVFAAHTHCPTCRSTAGFTDEVAAAVASKNVAVVHLVYDDNGTSCAKWREAYKLSGIANVKVYDDPNGAAFAKLKTSSYTAPSAFLDKNRVVTFKEHGLAKAQVLTQIDSALGR